jgi:hypothetical protein
VRRCGGIYGSPQIVMQDDLCDVYCDGCQDCRRCLKCCGHGRYSQDGIEVNPCKACDGSGIEPEKKP